MIQLEGVVIGGQGGMFDIAAKNHPALVKQAGGNVIEYTIPPDEFARWQKVAGQPVWDKWTQTMQAKGYKQAGEILSTLVQLTKSVKPQYK